MLEIKSLYAGYGNVSMVKDVSLTLNQGEVIAILGRNGVGRSTLAKAIMGLVACQGSVLKKVASDSVELIGLRPHQIARLGVGYVPEHKEIFSTLTVNQHLLLGSKVSLIPLTPILKTVFKFKRTNHQMNKNTLYTTDALYELFPTLKLRQHTLAGVLSGGEQQMLSLCRALMGNPDVLIIDEPTEGLAPKMVESVLNCLKELKNKGLAIILIEQKLSITLDIADTVCVMGHGTIVFKGTPQAFIADSDVKRRWLEV